MTARERKEKRKRETETSIPAGQRYLDVAQSNYAEIRADHAML